MSKYESDVTMMSRTMLLSELNALNYLEQWTLIESTYRTRLTDEFNRRIQYDCEAGTREATKESAWESTGESIKEVKNATD